MHQSLPQSHAERTAERDCTPETEDQDVSNGNEEQRYGQEERQQKNVKHQQCLLLVLPVEALHDNVVLDFEDITSGRHDRLDELHVSNDGDFGSFELNFVVVIIKDKQNHANREERNQHDDCFLVD